MLNETELKRAIHVAHFELMKLTHETLRPSQGFKMRTHGTTIAAIITCINHYEKELAALPVATPKAPVKSAAKKED